MIRLYSPDTITFNHNGLGSIHPKLCTVTEALNGIYELYMKMSIDSEHFSDIGLRSILMCKPNPHSDPQPFRIYRTTKPIDGVVSIYAKHISYDLSGSVVTPFEASDVGTALIGLTSNSIQSHEFTFKTDKSTVGNFSVRIPSTIRSVMGGQEGSIIDVYGGEYSYDIFSISLLNRRGADRGVKVKYGRNMRNLEQDSNCSNCCTGVVPYWSSLSGDKTIYGPVVNAPGSYGYTKIIPLDLTDRFEEEPSVSDLVSKATSYVSDNSIGVPTVSWEVEFLPLSKTLEYSDIKALEEVYLGDTISVQFEKLGVSATSRVVETTYNVLMDQYESVTLGRVKADLSDTLSSQSESLKSQKEELSKVPKMNNIEKMVSTLGDKITGVNGGSIRLIDTNADGEPDELYIANDPNPSLATKVWRYNYEGWAVSKTGYEGPFIMGATLEDGLLASFVTAANLVAGTIQSADGNTFYLNLDTGLLKISSNTQLIDAEGNTQQLATKKDIEDIGEGPPGVGIQSTTAYYYLSTSSTELKDGIWSTTMPTWIDGRYYWQKLKVVYTDGGEVETSPICVSGTKGNDGVGIVSVSAEYYLSTSATELKGGTWGTGVPIIEEGTYLWTRNCINYSDDQTGTTEAWCLSKGIREATQSIVSTAVDTAKEYASSLVSDSQGIVMEAVSECAKSSDLVSYQESLSAQLAVLDQGIQASVSKQELLEVTDAQGELQKFVNTIEKYLGFDATNGVTIGEVGSNVQQILDNDSQKIVIGGVPVQEVDAENGAQYTLVNVKNRLRLGNLVIYVEEDQSLSGRRAN